jgi:hypothetical protein
LEAGVNQISTRAEGAARRSRRGFQRFQGCSCGGSVAEVGEGHLPERRQRCPRGLRQQRRVARVGRSRVTAEQERLGQKGVGRAGVSEPASAREPGPAAMPGIDPMEGAPGHEPGCPKPAARESSPGVAMWSQVQRWIGSLRRGSGDPAPASLRDRGRQRSRRPVSLSQPKGAEGQQPTTVPERARRAAPGRRGRSCRGETPRSDLAAVAAARTAQPAAGSRFKPEMARDRSSARRPALAETPDRSATGALRQAR